MRLLFITATAFIASGEASKLAQRSASRVLDEVDDLLAKEDAKDAKALADKEFNDAGSKMN